MASSATTNLATVPLNIGTLYSRATGDGAESANSSHVPSGHDGRETTQLGGSLARAEAATGGYASTVFETQLAGVTAYFVPSGANMDPTGEGTKVADLAKFNFTPLTHEMSGVRLDTLGYIALTQGEEVCATSLKTLDLQPRFTAMWNQGTIPHTVQFTFTLPKTGVKGTTFGLAVEGAKESWGAFASRMATVQGLNDGFDREFDPQNLVHRAASPDVDGGSQGSGGGEPLRKPDAPALNPAGSQLPPVKDEERKDSLLGGNGSQLGTGLASGSNPPLDAQLDPGHRRGGSLGGTVVSPQRSPTTERSTSDGADGKLGEFDPLLTGTAPRPVAGTRLEEAQGGETPPTTLLDTYAGSQPPSEDEDGGVGRTTSDLSPARAKQDEDRELAAALAQSAKEKHDAVLGGGEDPLGGGQFGALPSRTASAGGERRSPTQNLDSRDSGGDTSPSAVHTDVV